MLIKILSKLHYLLLLYDTYHSPFSMFSVEIIIWITLLLRLHRTASVKTGLNRGSSVNSRSIKNKKQINTFENGQTSISPVLYDD